MPPIKLEEAGFVRCNWQFGSFSVRLLATSLQQA